jgi:hypothetical protein
VLKYEYFPHSAAGRRCCKRRTAAGSRTLVLASLLAALKSRGFNTLAFVVGLWQASVKELKLKKRGYPPKNIFRRGLNILCRLVTNFEHFDLIVWRKVIKLLSCS